jgi:hypothetical protein
MEKRPQTTYAEPAAPSAPRRTRPQPLQRAVTDSIYATTRNPIPEDGLIEIRPLFSTRLGERESDNIQQLSHG